ncbi:MAG: amidohydrolase [Rhizobiaceae bacterium]
MSGADQIWHNAKIQTMDAENPEASAFAASNGRIIAVGSDADILHLAKPRTEMSDLHGKQLLPGFVESHTHALWGACQDLFEVSVGYGSTYADLMGAVRSRVMNSKDGRLLTGGPWRRDLRQQMGPNPRKTLDAISTDIPIALSDVTKHMLWCNSLALEMAGIGDDAGDIAGGVIERDTATGKPNGILAETACAPVNKLSVRTVDQLAEATLYFVRKFNRLGFTAFKEPMAMEADLAAYKSADEREELTLHLAAHLVRQSPLVPELVDYEEMERWRREYSSTNVRTDFAKLFLDGVAPGFTASFLEPYLAESGYQAELHDPDATLLLSPDEIAREITELDRRGFTVKMHCVGDNAARKGLDGIEAARERNGPSGLRHEIAHSPFIQPDDLPRFTELDAVAEVSPKLWFPNAATAAQLSVLGKERVERCHPIRDYLEAGVNVTYASDWPAASPDPNPWTGLAGMISRTDPTGTYPGSVGKDQAISLNQALPLFTINGARSMRMETETGTISSGKWADFIILDEPLGTLSPEEIAAAEVRCTVWKGQTVFER